VKSLRVKEVATRTGPEPCADAARGVGDDERRQAGGRCTGQPVERGSSLHPGVPTQFQKVEGPHAPGARH